jgi:ubiquitin carboxyl-terminal hydrolase 16/45
MSMLGPHAPAGPIGVALKEFFLETRSGNDAGANMNPRKLLDSICPLDGRYRTTDHQDCQEFLVHLRNGLIEEELQARLPDVRKNVPTVVDSIFKGEVSIIKGM